MAQSKPQPEENVPAMQKLFDRPYFWLIAGFITMLVFYTGWGILEIVLMPTGQLP